jgi:hypothetical protein
VCVTCVVPMSEVEGGRAKGRMDRIVIGPRRRPDGGVPVLGCGRVAAVHAQLGDDLLVDGFVLAVALGSIGKSVSVADPLKGLKLPDEIIVDPEVAVQDDDMGAAMDAEEVLVEGVGEAGLGHRLCTGNAPRWMQPQTHATKQSHASQSKAEPKTPNSHTGRKAGLNHLNRGPGKPAHRGSASGSRRDVRA